MRETYSHTLDKVWGGVRATSAHSKRMFQSCKAQEEMTYCLDFGHTEWKVNVATV